MSSPGSQRKTSHRDSDHEHRQAWRRCLGTRWITASPRTTWSRTTTLYLRCRDGTDAPLYTGLAVLYPGHTTMADYIRTTLRGDNRTFGGHATFLRDRLNRDVARSRWRNEELIIHIVAFRGGVGRIRMTRRSRDVRGCTKWPTASAQPTTSSF
jgi:hypothetical protein